MTQDQTKEYEFLMNKLLHLENIIEQYKLQQDKQDNSNLIYHDRDLTDAISFDTGDTAWMLIASILVLLMTTPGIMLYYGGMVRLQNVLSTAMQGFSIACLVTFLWMAFGYSLVFAPINSTELSLTFMGNSQRFWLDKMTTDSYHSLAPNIPETIFCTYHLAFAIVTPSLICGAFADRMKFFSLLLCISLWHLGVYCPMAHMIWHPSGFLMKQGAIDYAGGIVVHVTAGFSALVASIILGRRTGLGKLRFHPHNMLLSITGASFLWIGWFGFIAGSAYAANDEACIAFLNTQIAAAIGSLAWMCIDILETGKPSILGMINGSIAGLVSVTPCGPYVNTSGAFIVGMLGGIACCYGVRIKVYFKFDDSLDAFGIHGIAGILGSLLAGCFAKHVKTGAFYGNPHLLLVQFYSILIAITYSTVVSTLIFVFVDKTVGLRVSVDVERVGLDRIEHGSSMYAQIQLHSRKQQYQNDGLYYKMVHSITNITRYIYKRLYICCFTNTSTTDSDSNSLDTHNNSNNSRNLEMNRYDDVLPNKRTLVHQDSPPIDPAIIKSFSHDPVNIQNENNQKNSNQMYDTSTHSDLLQSRKSTSRYDVETRNEVDYNITSNNNNNNNNNIEVFKSNSSSHYNVSTRKNNRNDDLDSRQHDSSLHVRDMSAEIVLESKQNENVIKSI